MATPSRAGAPRTWDARLRRGLKMTACALGASLCVGPSGARDFGDHERPWARDVVREPLAADGSCPSLFTQLGREQVEAGLAPSLGRGFAAGERALALAQARSARLDAQEQRLLEAKERLDVATVELRDQMRALQALQRSVAEEIDRLDGLESEAEGQRVDLLRALRPRDAAGVLANTALEESAQLLAALQPREAAAILKEMPAKKAEALFVAMRGGVEPDAAE